MTQARSRRSEYTEATRRALLDAASTLFVERGYTSTSLDDVAAAARVTKGAIYHHFPSKTGLLEALFSELEETEYARTRAVLASVDGPVEGTFAALDRFLEACCQPVYGAIVFRESPIALGWDRWRQNEERFCFALVDDLLTRLADAGMVPPARSEALVSIIVGMLSAAGQLLARTPAQEQERVRAECRAPFVALISGIASGGESRPDAGSG